MTHNIKLHSTYAPQKEAERFCLTINGNPKIIVVTEPGESYLAASFRNFFPKTKIIALRYTDTLFLESDSFWDAVWRPCCGSLTLFLLNNIPDEFLNNTVFLRWKPSDLIWSNTAHTVWQDISAGVKIIQNIIATRTYFGKRWLKNIFTNLLFAKKIISFDMNVKDSFFAAAGPSLEFLLNKNTECLKNKFILTSSSAIKALLERGVTPHCCISTDGGFWAEGHLKNISGAIPLLFPIEARIPKNLLIANECAFLNYGSQFEKNIFDKLKIKTIYGKRNGTVSGTAIEYLLDSTSGNIYTAGLDLQNSKGFSHARPHESISKYNAACSKISPISTYTAVSNLNTQQLNTYSEWFSQLAPKKSNRVFRIGSGGKVLKNIKNISIEEFYKIENIHTYKFEKIKQTCNYDYTNIIFEFYKNIKNEIRDNTFFEKLDLQLSGNNKNIEAEICEFVSFNNYIQYIKHRDGDDAIKYKKILQDELSMFFNEKLKWIQNEN